MFTVSFDAQLIIESENLSFDVITEFLYINKSHSSSLHFVYMSEDVDKEKHLFFRPVGYQFHSILPSDKEIGYARQLSGDGSEFIYEKQLSIIVIFMSFNMSAPSPEHQRIVGALKGILEQQYGYTITCGDYGNLQPCQLVSNYRPDLGGNNPSNNHVVIGEAERCEELQSQQTLDQIKAFADYIKDKQLYYLHIAVPQNCLSQLANILAQLGLANRKDILTHGV